MMKFAIDILHIPSPSFLAQHTARFSAYTIDGDNVFQDLHEFYLGNYFAL
jgi:hypothetical protein